MVRLFLAVVVCATLATFAINSRVGVPPVEAAAAGLRDASARSRQSSADSGERRRTQGATTLDDQVELAVTVYNSDIALVRDVRNLQLPRGTFDLQLHGHRRDGESGDGALPLAHRAVARERARAELRVRPARARQAAAQVRRPRRHARAHAAGGRHRRARKK